MKLAVACVHAPPLLGVSLPHLPCRLAEKARGVLGLEAAHLGDGGSHVVIRNDLGAPGKGTTGAYQGDGGLNIAGRLREAREESLDQDLVYARQRLAARNGGRRHLLEQIGHLALRLHLACRVEHPPGVALLPYAGHLAALVEHARVGGNRHGAGESVLVVGRKSRYQGAHEHVAAQVGALFMLALRTATQGEKAAHLLPYARLRQGLRGTGGQFGRIGTLGLGLKLGGILLRHERSRNL